jgi:NTP pyrophosphatase (non-canonical NTP hydrolase)
MENQKSPQQLLLEKYGVLAQADIWVEELSELIQAIQKAKRYKVLTQGGILRLGYNLTPNQEKALLNLYEEIADVKNVILQFEVLADIYELHRAKNITKDKIKAALKD